MPKFRKLHMIHLLKFQQRLCLGCKNILNYGNIVKENRINISLGISPRDLSSKIRLTAK